MKKITTFLKGIILGALITVMTVFCFHVANNYSIKGYVNSVTEKSVFFTDITGNVWEYYFDKKITKNTFKEHEGVVLYFYNNCSDNNRQDDIITVVKRGNE